MKKVIICIHGFKTGNYHDFDLFEKYVNEHPELYQGEIVKINLYDINDKKTFKAGKWKKTAMAQIEPYLQDYQIYLIGYSMGSGVACYIASKIRVEKLILIAPLFHLIGSKMLSHNIKLLLKSWKMKLFQRKKMKQLKRFKKLKKKMVPFGLVINIAYSVKSYKKYVRRVHAESLVMLGLADDYSPLRSASFAFKRIKSKKKELWFVDHINHLFIFSKDVAPDIFIKLLNFIQGNEITTYYK